MLDIRSQKEDSVKTVGDLYPKRVQVAFVVPKHSAHTTNLMPALDAFRTTPNNARAHQQVQGIRHRAARETAVTCR